MEELIVVSHVVLVDEFLVDFYVVVVVVVEQVHECVVWFHVLRVFTLFVDGVFYAIITFEVNPVVHVFLELL